MTDVAIIGAGPYGLSIGAHLKARGIGFRIFGKAMHAWLAHMPKGMHLKSEGFASGLYDPDSAFTLAKYCEREGVPYADIGVPTPLEVFSSYGLEFQHRCVPELENKSVVSLVRSAPGFRICLGDGEAVDVRKTVIATGLNGFEQVPPILSALGEQWVTHSARYGNLDHFKGKDMIVIGAGSSALELAALLHEVGACVQLVARAPVINFHNPPEPMPRPWLREVRRPITGLGPGSWRAAFFTAAPQMFRQMPLWFRRKLVQDHIRPAPAWFVKDRVVGKVPFHLGARILQAEIQDSRVRLQLADRSGKEQTLAADHIIAATGFTVELDRLQILEAELRTEIRCVEQSPVLSANFESSVPGLYFVGPIAAISFGPLMRFAFGAQYAAARLSKHLAKEVSHNVESYVLTPNLGTLGDRQ
jgi:cation diffusion facilitator CzcD-associated flavoprotein CzcO